MILPDSDQRDATGRERDRISALDPGRNLAVTKEGDDQLRGARTRDSGKHDIASSSHPSNRRQRLLQIRN